MPPRCQRCTLTALLSCAICIGILVPAVVLAQAYSPFRPTAPSSETANPALSTLTDTVQLFLPTITKPADPPTVSLGVDFGNLSLQQETVAQDYPVAQAMGATWMRAELPWLLIEPVQGTYNFTPYDTILDQAQSLHFSVLGTIHSAPDWAAPEGCGPIADLAAFETFMRTLVTRYKDKVAAWEFMNEPDGKAPWDKYGPGVGCWAPYPEQYAQQLALFHKIVKELDPTALVFFGGLAYDNWEHFDRNFLANVLQYGVGDDFDGIGVHYYPINPEEFPTMGHKIDEIRAILERYLVWNKLIWVNETAAWTNAPNSVETQRNYIVAEQARGFCHGANNMFWFGIRQEAPDPPLHRWLINLNHQPDQGYSTYQFFASQIIGMTCKGRDQNVPSNAEAYLFTRAGSNPMYVVWANSDTATISLPAGNATLTARDGGNTTLAGVNGQVTFTVGQAPVYVTIEP